MIPFIAMSAMFLGLSIVTMNLEGILPSVVGLVLFSMFHSMTRGSWVTLHEDSMEIRFGFFTRFRLPYQAIEKVEPVEQPWFYGLGVKYVGKHTLAFVTDAKNVVELALREPVPIRFSVVPITLRPRALRLSIANVTSFLENLRVHLGGG
jgi:hypothetical protein